MAGGAKTIESTSEALAALQNQLHELDQEFREELRQVEQKYNPSAENLEPVGFAPKQTNVSVAAFVPVWAPYALLPDGGIAGIVALGCISLLSMLWNFRGRRPCLVQFIKNLQNFLEISSTFLLFRNMIELDE